MGGSKPFGPGPLVWFRRQIFCHRSNPAGMENQDFLAES
jgi:hypothetical protein